MLMPLTVCHRAPGKAQAYIVSGSSLLEVQRFKQFYSAWLVDGSLVAGEGMHAQAPEPRAHAWEPPPLFSPCEHACTHACPQMGASTCPAQWIHCS
jgi:hypothetical protein